MSTTKVNVEASGNYLKDAKNTLSDRGRGAARPPLSYFKAFQKAQADMYNPETNPHGYVVMSVAENKLNFQMMADKLKQCVDLPYATGGYTNMRGWEHFRSSFAKTMKRTLFPSGPSLDTNGICVAAGCGALIENLTFMLANPGDSILIPAPFYPAFDNDCVVRVDARTHAVPLVIQLEDSGEAAGKRLKSPKIDFAALEKAYTDCAESDHPARMLILTNPNNPTGHIYPADEIWHLVTWCRERKVHLVVDEVYANSVFNPNPDHQFISIIDVCATHADSDNENYLGDYVHVLWGYSKDFGMSGYRVGVLYSQNSAVLQALDNINYFCAVSNDTQERLAQALDDEEWTDKYLQMNREVVAKNYSAFISKIDAGGIPYLEPHGGMFVWLDLRKLLPATTEKLEQADWDREKELANTLVDECKLLLSPGEACHGHEPGFFRACVAWMPTEAVIVGAERLVQLYQGQ